MNNEESQGLLALSEHISQSHIGAPDEPCRVCLEAKGRKRNLKKIGFQQPKEILKIFGLDLQGPYRNPDINGNPYKLKIVDKKSGYIKTVPLKTKSSEEVTDAFARFVTISERQTGKKLKMVRTDGGTEFEGSFLTYKTKELRKLKESLTISLSLQKQKMPICWLTNLQSRPGQPQNYH